MRWVLLLAAMVGFFVAFTTNSPGILGLGLLIGLGGAIGFVFAMAASRIAANAQPETALIVDPEVSALRKRASQKKLDAPNVTTAGAEASSDHLT